MNTKMMNKVELSDEMMARVNGGTLEDDAREILQMEIDSNPFSHMLDKLFKYLNVY